MKDLETRVAALERSNRRYRFFFGIVVLALAGLVALGAGGGVPDKIQAKSFEVVDDAGGVLASMTTYLGNGSVTTYNPQGKILTDMVATKSGAGGIVTYDGAGHQNLKITDVTGGGGSIVVNNADGKSVVEIQHNTVAAGSIMCRNKSGNPIDQVTSDTKEAGAVLTYDETGKQSGRLPQ
jgi:hypothetical protein